MAGYPPGPSEVLYEHIIQRQTPQSWREVWTEAKNREEAWNYFLGRKFRGLDAKLYEEPFNKEIDDR